MHDDRNNGGKCILQWSPDYVNDSTKITYAFKHTKKKQNVLFSPKIIR